MKSTVLKALLPGINELRLVRYCNVMVFYILLLYSIYFDIYLVAECANLISLQAINVTK